MGTPQYRVFARSRGDEAHLEAAGVNDGPGGVTELLQDVAW